MSTDFYDDFKAVCSKYANTAAETEVDNVYSVREDSITRHSSLRKVGAMPCATVKLNSDLQHGATFFMPIWHVEQEKLSFLPSMLSMAIQNSCRLVVLFDSKNDWETIEKIQKQTADPRRPAHVDMNLQDVAFDVSMEKEVHSTVQGSGVVLSWIRSGEMFSCFQNEGGKTTNSSVTGETVTENIPDSKSKSDPTSVDYDPFTGYRCAFLRCEHLHHDCAFKNAASWNGFNELYSMACGEVAAAYGQLNILMIDVGGGLRLSKPTPTVSPCSHPPHFYWGVGNRAGLVVALDAAIATLLEMLKSRDHVITLRPPTAVEATPPDPPVPVASTAESVRAEKTGEEVGTVTNTGVAVGTVTNTGGGRVPVAPTLANSGPVGSGSGVECVVLDPFQPPAPPLPRDTKTKSLRTAAISSMTISQPAGNHEAEAEAEPCVGVSAAAMTEEAIELSERLRAAADTHAEHLRQSKAQAQERLKARIASRKIAKMDTAALPVPASVPASVTPVGGVTGGSDTPGQGCSAAVSSRVSSQVCADADLKLSVAEQIERLKSGYRASRLFCDNSLEGKLRLAALAETKAIVSSSGSNGATNDLVTPDDEVLWQIHCIVRSTLLELGYTSPDLLPSKEQYCFMVRQLVSIANDAVQCL